MTKLTFLRKHGKKAGIGIAVGGTALLATGLSLFFVGGLARPTLIGDNNVNVSYAQTSALNFEKISTFRALNNGFSIAGGQKLFAVTFDANNDITVIKRIAFPNSEKIKISSVGSFVDWVSANSFSFDEYFSFKQAEIDALPPSAAKQLLVNTYNFEYAMTLGAVLNFQLFIAGAVLFPLALIPTIFGSVLAIKSKNY